MDLSSLILYSSVAPSLHGSFTSPGRTRGVTVRLVSWEMCTDWQASLGSLNFVGVRVISLVANLLERSVPLSSPPFPLYKLALLPLIFYFPRWIHNQSATIYPVKPAYRQLGASVIYTFHVAHLQLVSTLHLLLNSLVIFLILHTCHLCRSISVLGFTCHV